MPYVVDNDIAALNFYYRNKLKKSLTYLITNGYFNHIRTLIDASKNEYANPNSDVEIDDTCQIINKVDINETDEWWISNSFSKVRKSSAHGGRIFCNTSPPPIVQNRESNGTSSSCSNYNSYFSFRSGETSSQVKLKNKSIGRTSLMLCSLIEDDAWSYSIAQNLIESGAKLGLKDSNGFNALMYACFYERTNILELFLNAPGDYNLLTKDKYGNTAFHLASLGRTEQNCTILHKLAAKFNIDVQSKVGKNYFDHTPYDLCKLNGHETCLKNLYNKSVQFMLNDTFLNSKKDINLLQTSMDPLINNSVIPQITLNQDDKNTIDTKGDSELFSQVKRESKSLEIDKPIFKSSCESISVRGQSADVYEFKKNTITASLRLKQFQRSSKEPNPLDTYKFLFVMKEPLIKQADHHIKQIFAKKNQIIRSHSRHVFNQEKYIITRKIIQNDHISNEPSLRESTNSVQTNYKRIQYNNSDTFTNTTTNSKNNIGSSDSDNSNSSYLSWRESMIHIFDSVEFQKTKSFRKTNTNISTNLFEQLTNGIFLNVNLSAQEQNSRRNSLMRKQASQLSMNSQDRRQSISGSVKNMKPSGVQRRTSKKPGTVSSENK